MFNPKGFVGPPPIPSNLQPPAKPQVADDDKKLRPVFTLIWSWMGTIGQFVTKLAQWAAYYQLNGVAPSKHNATHLPDSEFDPLPTGTPRTVEITNDEGTSNDFARGNHTHRLGIVTTQGDLLGHDGVNPIRLAAPTVVKGGVFVNPTATSDVTIWRAPWACTVTAVKGFRSGGTSATVNARKNASELLASDLVLGSADVWLDGGAVQNTAFAVGDSLQLRLKALTGMPSEVALQVEFSRP